MQIFQKSMLRNIATSNANMAISQSLKIHKQNFIKNFFIMEYEFLIGSSFCTLKKRVLLNLI